MHTSCCFHGCMINLLYCPLLANSGELINEVYWPCQQEENAAVSWFNFLCCSRKQYKLLIPIRSLHCLCIKFFVWHHQSLIIFCISCRQTTHPKLIIAFIAVSDTFTRADLWPREAIQDTVANGYLEACQMKRDWQRRLETASSAVNTELGKDITGKNMQSKHFPCWAVDVKSLAQLAQSFAAVIAWWELIILVAAWKHFHTGKKCQNVKIKTDSHCGASHKLHSNWGKSYFFQGLVKCYFDGFVKKTLTSVSFELG